MVEGVGGEVGGEVVVMSMREASYPYCSGTKTYERDGEGYCGCPLGVVGCRKSVRKLR